MLERADPQRGAVRAELAVGVELRTPEQHAAGLAERLPTEVLRELDALAHRLGGDPPETLFPRLAPPQ